MTSLQKEHDVRGIEPVGDDGKVHTSDPGRANFVESASADRAQSFHVRTQKFRNT